MDDHKDVAESYMNKVLASHDSTNALFPRLSKQLAEMYVLSSGSINDSERGDSIVAKAAAASSSQVTNTTNSHKSVVMHNVDANELSGSL